MQDHQGFQSENFGDWCNPGVCPVVILGGGVRKLALNTLAYSGPDTLL